MEIILLEYIEKVGDKHDVVKVRNGYGRNYLIPKGLAIVANKSNMARLEGLKKQFAKKEAAKLDTYRGYAEKLAGTTLKIVSKAGESGRLFGSVKAQNLIDAIKEELGFEVERRVIQMPEEVKELGSYEAVFKFHEEVITTVKFDVVLDKNLDTGGTTTPPDKGTRAEAKAAAAPAAPPVAEPEPAVKEEPAVEAAPEVVEEVVEETIAEVVEESAPEADVVETVEAVAEEAEASAEEAAEEIAEAPAADAAEADEEDKTA